MSPSEHPTPPISGRTHRTDGAVASRPMVWILGTACALVGTGLLIVWTNPASTATRSWQTAGTLLIALGIFVFIAIPGALEALGHPWAAAMRRPLEQRFNHPRLLGLAQVWAGVLVPGWLSVMILVQLPASFVPITSAVLPVGGLGPLYAIVLFDHRR
jgi:hypothetical protein